MVLTKEQVVLHGDFGFQSELGLEGLPGMEPAGLHAFPGYPPGVSHTTDVSEPAAAQRDICMAGTVFQEVCGHGNWRWIWTPCDKWTCDVCRQTKLFGELVPEIIKALVEARRQRFTLKLLTLTWQGQSLGAQPTSEGARRRGLDQQHLIQWLRRNGYLSAKGEVFYLRVAETHKSGKVHLHLYIIAPFIAHEELKEVWWTITGGSYIIDLQTVYLKCPRCWVKGQSRREKHLRRMVPWPGTNKCSECGYDAWMAGPGVLANAIAVEAGKYLAKDGTDGIQKKLTRSGSVKRFCSRCDGLMRQADAEHGMYRCRSCEQFDADPVVVATGWARFRWEVEQEKAEQRGKGFCDDCEDEHAYTYVGTQLELLRNYPGLETVIGFNEGRGMGWMPVGGAPCLCWGQDLAWMNSKLGADSGLGDLVHYSRDGPSSGGSQQ